MLLVCAGKSKGEEGNTGPAGFSSWISRELGRAEALLKVVGSRPDTLADNFFTLMPSGTLPDYQRIIDLKVCTAAATCASCTPASSGTSSYAAAQQLHMPSWGSATSTAHGGHEW